MEKAGPFGAVARLIRARRELLGIPLRDLARDMRVTPVLLALERGQVDPRGLHALAQQALTRQLSVELTHSQRP